MKGFSYLRSAASGWREVSRLRSGFRRAARTPRNRLNLRQSGSDLFANLTPGSRAPHHAQKRRVLGTPRPGLRSFARFSGRQIRFQRAQRARERSPRRKPGAGGGDEAKPASSGRQSRSTCSKRGDRGTR